MGNAHKDVTVKSSPAPKTFDVEIKGHVVGTYTEHRWANEVADAFCEYFWAIEREEPTADAGHDHAWGIWVRVDAAHQQVRYCGVWGCGAYEVQATNGPGVDGREGGEPFGSGDPTRDSEQSEAPGGPGVRPGFDSQPAVSPSTPEPGKDALRTRISAALDVIPGIGRDQADVVTDAVLDLWPSEAEAERDTLKGALREVLEHYHAPCPECWDVIGRAYAALGEPNQHVIAPATHDTSDGDDFTEHERSVSERFREDQKGCGTLFRDEFGVKQMCIRDIPCSVHDVPTACPHHQVNADFSSWHCAACDQEFTPAGISAPPGSLSARPCRKCRTLIADPLNLLDGYCKLCFVWLHPSKSEQEEALGAALDKLIGDEG